MDSHPIGYGQMMAYGFDSIATMLEQDSYLFKMLVNDAGVVLFPHTTEHRDASKVGINYADDSQGNALAAIVKPGRVEIRFHQEFSDERVRRLLQRILLLPELEFARSFVFTYQARTLTPAVNLFENMNALLNGNGRLSATCCHPTQDRTKRSTRSRRSSRSRINVDFGGPVNANVLSLNQPNANWIVFRKLTSIIRQLLGRTEPEPVGHPDIGTAHLQYESLEDWMTGENVPMGFTKEPNSVLRDKYIRQYGELRRHLYAKHVLTLSPDDQKAIGDGCHPSQSHRFADNAQPYCELLKQHLAAMGLDVSDVQLGRYHMDRIVLSVETHDKIDVERIRQLPWLFQGFEIKYIYTVDRDATEQSGEPEPPITRGFEP